MEFLARTVFYNVRGHDKLLVINNEKIKNEKDLIEITSGDFPNGVIPLKFSAYGELQSPSFSIKLKEPVPEAASIVFVCQDPDAPVWFAPVHLVTYGISPEGANFEQGELLKESSKYKFGKGFKSSLGYRGPRPPAGHGTHRYFFEAFAINEKATKKLQAFTEPPSLDEVVQVIVGNVLAKGSLIGKFSKDDN